MPGSKILPPERVNADRLAGQPVRGAAERGIDMIYYENLSFANPDDILLAAANDTENFSKQERESAATLGNAYKKYLDAREDFYSANSSTEPQKPDRASGLYWKKAEGNKGLVIWERNRKFGFLVQGYFGHNGYSTPGIGLVENQAAIREYKREEGELV